MSFVKRLFIILFHKKKKKSKRQKNVFNKILKAFRIKIKIAAYFVKMLTFILILIGVGVKKLTFIFR